jgi:soluble lytic murein transglycosylase-like protein
MRSLPLACAAVLQFVAFSEAGAAQKAARTNSNYESMVAMHAAANGVPASLVHRVIMRESRYNPRAVSHGNFGMMQIKLATARSLGYSGTAQGLLDPNTNLTYAVKYLAGAYRVAGGNSDRAVSYYARGYYYAEKRQRTAHVARRQNADPMTTGSITAASRPSRRAHLAQSGSLIGNLFSSVNKAARRPGHHGQGQYARHSPYRHYARHGS